MSDVASALERQLGAGRVKIGEPLAPYTTFKVGGAAEWLVEPRGRDELVATLQIAHAMGLPVTMLGGGSNVLVSDLGVRGLVVRPRGGDVERVSDTEIRSDAAVTMNGLVRWTITHGAAGLEAWAGTPGTVGGAIHGNAHFGGRNISEYVTRVELWDASGACVAVPRAAMEFGYDRSRLQTTHEVLLAAVFSVSPGHPAALRAVARESLAFRKRTQPLESPSAGCIFQNPQRGTDHVPSGIPWSAGALVDRAGLKGVTEGGARVALTHGNFIVNAGSASARDIRTLINRCRDEVFRQFGVELREEIVYLGDFES